MLDKRTSAVLDKINTLCSDGSYKIVEADELLAALPASHASDAEGLSQMLRYLSEHEYIDIKYAEGDVYCVCPLPGGRMYFENVKETKSTSFRRRRDTVLLTALGAFLGAFLGSVVVWLMITFLF